MAYFEYTCFFFNSFMHPKKLNKNDRKQRGDRSSQHVGPLHFREHFFSLKVGLMKITSELFLKKKKRFFSKLAQNR